MHLLRKHQSGRRRATAALVVILAASAGGCSSQEKDSAQQGPTVDLAAFTLFRKPAGELTRSFNSSPAGKDVRFTESFAPSGALASGLTSGTQKADVAMMSTSLDVDTLAAAGLTAKDWRSEPHRGIFARTAVVFMVRRGNPKNIRTWADLARPGVSLVSDDPVIASKWDLTAAYTQAKAAGQSQAAIEAYLRKVYANVRSWNQSGSSATAQFVSGQGDVFVTYETNAIAQRAAGQAVDYVIPDRTLLVEYPAVALAGPDATAAKQFLNHVRGERGQNTLARAGYRPIIANLKPRGVQGANDPDNPFPALRHPVTIDQVGGWAAVNKTLYNPTTGLFMKLRG